MYPPFQEMCSCYAQALSGLSAQVLELHPDGDLNRWNGRQILEHLLLTYKVSGSVFRERLEKGRPTQSPIALKQRAAQFVLLGLGYFPQGRVAPPVVTPQPVPNGLLDGPSLAMLLSAGISEMDEALILCRQKFGRQAFAAHQILGPLTADQWRRFHFVHGSHHLKQMNRLNLK